MINPRLRIGFHAARLAIGFEVALSMEPEKGEMTSLQTCLYLKWTSHDGNAMYS
jgi:hypothetical protein